SSSESPKTVRTHCSGCPALALHSEYAKSASSGVAPRARASWSDWTTDTSSAEEDRRQTNSSAGQRLRAGCVSGRKLPLYSSSTAWKLVPPKPKALTPATRGSGPPWIHGRASVLRKNGLSPKFALLLGFSTRSGGSTL